MAVKEFKKTDYRNSIPIHLLNFPILKTHQPFINEDSRLVDQTKQSTAKNHPTVLLHEKIVTIIVINVANMNGH